MFYSPFSIISMLIGVFFLIYLWLPLFFIFVGFAIVYIICSYIFAKITGKPVSSVKIVKIYRTGDMYNPQDTPSHQRIDNNDDIIDSTTADKDK